MDEVKVLADALLNSFPQVAIRNNYGWPQNSAACVIDCVLSLNRRYDSFALPRVRSFRKQYPDVVELTHLRDLLGEYTNVGDFFQRELRYNHAQREQILRGVTDYLIAAQEEQSGNSEWDRLQAWAVAVNPADYHKVGVKGFKLAGFQYLRMRFGVQTTKPDVHIIRFVSNVLERPVNPSAALYLLEAASTQAGLPLREVDGAIWNTGARRASRDTGS